MAGAAAARRLAEAGHAVRIFDKGRVLPPLDKLRMPNFDLTEEENNRLLTAIMSFQREIQPQAALPARSARNDYIAEGRTLVNRRNCVGCHIIEGGGGDYLGAYAAKASPRSGKFARAQRYVRGQPGRELLACARGAMYVPIARGDVWRLLAYGEG